LSLFNALETGFYRKLVALRNLEAKILKTANLCGTVHGLKPGATPGVNAENTTLKDRLALSRQITCKWAVSGRR